jgi:hypothetical protein
MRSLLPIAVATLLAASVVQAGVLIPQNQLPPKENFKIYLLMGQSNMAGRGAPSKIDRTPHPRVFRMADNGTWMLAVEPVTHEPGYVSGVGPGLAFGKVMADSDPNVTIGLVSAALGNTKLVRWEKGGDLYNKAIKLATLAMQNGTLAGILWHQGEADCKYPENALSYEARLQQMISDLRTDLANPKLPVVVGELGTFVINRIHRPQLPLARIVDAALLDIPNTVPLTGCASSDGLKHLGDETHFNAASQRIFGGRYAVIMLTLQQSLQVQQDPFASSAQ